MKIASVAEVKARLSAYLKASEEGPVVVTRNGKPVAVLLALADEEEIERLVLGYSPRFRSLLEEARQQIREGSGIPHDEFWQELEADQGEPDTPPADEGACIPE
jgi:prevent-host-death family protein